VTLFELSTTTHKTLKYSYNKWVKGRSTLKLSHYSIIFVFGIIAGWAIYQVEHKNSYVMYDQPSVCEVVGKNHPQCK
jgi:hypothetical protein